MSNSAVAAKKDFELPYKFHELNTVFIQFKLFVTS